MGYSLVYDSRDDIYPRLECETEYDEIFAAWLRNALWTAYLEARKGKRSTSDEHVFELNATENVLNLRNTILARQYKPNRGIAFVVKRPVVREIFAAPFRDRVVHHFLYDMVADWWDRRLIYDSYSCRKGKGVLFGIKRLEKHMRSVSRNYTIPTYVIKLDIQGYFMSLPRDRLMQKINWGLKRQYPNGGRVYETVKYLWEEVIFDNPTENVRRRGQMKNWDLLPKSKSLFCQPPGQGIVIGNLSSQLLSNIYLDPLDRFVTMELGWKHYGRYVDDFYYVVTEEELPQALRDIKVIEDYLAGMGLTLHPKKRHIQNIKRGIPFLGVVVYPGRIIPGKRIKQYFWEAAWMYAHDFTDEASIISYLGHMKHMNARKVEKAVFDAMGWRYRF